MNSTALIASPSGRKLMSPNHGISGWSEGPSGATSKVMREGPRREGLVSREATPRILDVLLVPRDARGIVLLCGFVAVAIFGLMAILSPPGDPLGWAYIALGLVGYLFIQTRLITTFIWLLVAAGGAAVAWAGNPAGWAESGLGVALALVSLVPLPPEYRECPNPKPIQISAGPPPQLITTNGGQEGSRPDSSSHEDLQIQASATTEVLGDQTAHSNGSTEAKTNPAGIAIHAIGHLRIAVGGRDITRRLSEPRLQFLLSYLLARQIRGVEVAADRTALAEEVAHGISTGHQRNRLRKQLYDLQAADPVFDRLLRTNRSQIWLDLQGVDFDATALLEASRLIRDREYLIDAELADEIRHQLEASKGEFLAGFSELEHQVTEGRGTASQIVEEARARVAGARADLAVALGQHDIAAGRPARAIPYLTDVLAACPQRQDLARVLAAALLQTGQPAAATQVRRQHDLEEN